MTNITLSDPSARSARVRAILRNPDANIILDAKKFCADETAIFRLASGRYQQHFVSLWQLFDEESFPTVVSDLADLVEEVRQKTDFQDIVSCTITSRHLLDSIHSKVDSQERPLGAVYFGPTPFANPDHGPYPDLKGRRVLVLTDVVASASLVTRLARTLQELGAIVVGAVAVVSTNSKDKDHVSGTYPIEGRAEPLTITFLATHTVDSYTTPPKGATPWNIDPLTVFPEQDAPSKGVTPLFDAQETVDHFERTNALEVGFFRVEDRCSLSAIRTERLLKNDHVGSEIWSKLLPCFARIIQPSLAANGITRKSNRSEKVSSASRVVDSPSSAPNDCAIVSTYDPSDMAFRRFVGRGLDQYRGRKTEYVMLARRESGAGPWRYFPLKPDVDKLAGKRHIFLLLSSTHTSETLRELVATIAPYSAAETITVLCLLNRMGDWTNDFVSRIKKLIGRTDDAATFEFVPVYNVPDFPRHEIIEMQESADRLLSDFGSKCDIQLVRDLIEQDRKHFVFESVTSFRFCNPGPDDSISTDKFPMDGMMVGVGKAKSKQLVVTSYTAAKRNYDILLSELGTETEKGRLYFFFAILLGDVDLLKVRRTYHRVLEGLMHRVRALMANRLLLEEQGAIEKLVLTEAHLCLGIGLLSYRDIGSDYSGFLQDRMTGSASESWWIEHPKQFSAYFGSERWLMSMALLLFYLPRPATEEVSKLLIERLLDVNSIANKLAVGTPDETNKAAFDHVVLNVGSLLRMLGAHKGESRQRIVRYLHRIVIAPKENHNPIATNLRIILEDILSSFEDVRRATEEEGTAVLPHTLLKLGEIPTIERGMAATGTLDELSKTLKEFLSFSGMRGDSSRFVALDSPETFADDIRTMSAILLQVRTSLTISEFQIDQLYKSWDRLRADLFEDGPLRQALLDYVSPVKATLARMMRAARSDLEKRRSAVNWPVAAIRKLDAEAEKDERFVLLHIDELQEILKNLLTNVRYQQLPGKRKKQPQPKPKVYIDWTEGPSLRTSVGGVEAEELDACTITVLCEGTSFSSQTKRTGPSTMRRHIEYVRQFGGSLEITDLKPGIGCKATLKLISREPKSQPLVQQTNSVGKQHGAKKGRRSLDKGGVEKP